MMTTKPQNKATLPAAAGTAGDLDWAMPEKDRQTKTDPRAFGYPRVKAHQSPAESDALTEQPEPWDGLS